MLAATAEETEEIREYMNWQARDLKVTFLQKVYVENVASHLHAVWDVHTNKDRWWVITNPTNLYSQTQFPNLDLAVTFHVGLCIRIPRSEEPKIGEMPIEPFVACFRLARQAVEALATAGEVSDYQAIGVRCREALLSLSSVGQVLIPWEAAPPAPKQADFKAWSDHLCNSVFVGAAHEERRHLLKALLQSAWRYSNWLTHAKASRWHDAEAASSTVEHALSLLASALIRHVRGVPETCPACGSHRLAPERGYHTSDPEQAFERPTCMVCDWVGLPVPIPKQPGAYEAGSDEPPEGECVTTSVPLTHIVRP